MRCPNCEAAEMAEARENYLFTESGLSSVTLVGIGVRRCAACGNVMPKRPTPDPKAFRRVLIEKN